MLYATTRSQSDIYTENHPLCEDRAQDGGLFVPFRMPELRYEEIVALAEVPFSQRMADILNRLFRSKLTGWDIDFTVGRYPVRLTAMSHRITVGECWHNPVWSFDWMVGRLCGLLRGSEGAESTEWVRIGVRAAVLFGIFGELMKSGEASPASPVDVAVPLGDMSGVMAAWYARSWGLPIATIVICTNENSCLWDLLHRGELRTGSVAAQTATPLCDQVLPRSLERLIHACGGTSEVARYLAACSRGAVYAPGDAVLKPMRQDLSVSVVSETRMRSAIPNLYRSAGYISGPYTALCHSGLQDYRARTGESRPALVLSERSPGCDEQTVADAMGVSAAELKALLKKV